MLQEIRQTIEGKQKELNELITMETELINTCSHEGMKFNYVGGGKFHAYCQYCETPFQL